MPEVYIRGNTVKYLRLPDEVLEKAREYELRKHERRNAGRGGGRGGGRGAGRGGGGYGGRGSVGARRAVVVVVAGVVVAVAVDGVEASSRHDGDGSCGVSGACVMTHVKNERRTAGQPSTPNTFCPLFVSSFRRIEIMGDDIGREVAYARRSRTFSRRKISRRRWTISKRWTMTMGWMAIW